MGNDFQYDVFLSHSSKDKTVVREIAERLHKDGLKVWFDEWVLRAGDSIPAKIEEGLEHSRVLVLCMSANAFSSDWAQLEAGTFRFRDPLNKERRFIPLQLDESPIKGSLVQFFCINWRPAQREREYKNLLCACRDSAGPVRNDVVVEELPSGYAFDTYISGNADECKFGPDASDDYTFGERTWWEREFDREQEAERQRKASNDCKNEEAEDDS